VEARLGRAVSLPVCARNVREIDNDGPLGASVTALIGTILECLADGQVAVPVPVSG
jgi:ribose 1,5-bisphosphokinase PhnN